MINFSGNTCLYWMKAATAGMHAQQRIGEKWRETDNKNYIAFTLMNMMIMCQSNNNFVKQLNTSNNNSGSGTRKKNNTLISSTRLNAIITCYWWFQHFRSEMYVRGEFVLILHFYSAAAYIGYLHTNPSMLNRWREVHYASHQRSTADNMLIEYVMEMKHNHCAHSDK